MAVVCSCFRNDLHDRLFQTEADTGSNFKVVLIAQDCQCPARAAQQVSFWLGALACNRLRPEESRETSEFSKELSRYRIGGCQNETCPGLRKITRKPPYLANKIDEQNTDASFSTVVGTGEYYGLSREDMRRLVRKTVTAISTWRTVAANVKLPKREIERMAGAFEHAASQEACVYVR